MPSKDRLFAVLRLALTVALLAFLVERIGLDQLRTVLGTLNPVYYLAILALLLADAILRALNWARLLGTRGSAVRLRETLYSYLVGGFFGTFIPSSLGTDVTRAILVARRNNIGAADSASAMVVLNLMSLLALCLIGLVSAGLMVTSIGNSQIAIPIALICLAYLALFPFLIRGWLPFAGLFKGGFLGGLADRARGFAQVLSSYADRPRTLAAVLGVAFLNQTLSIIIVYTVSLFLALNVPILYFVAFVPVITLSRLVPVSVAGLGAEQGIFVFLFHQAGVPPAEAFLMSLVLSVTNVSFFSSGGLLYAATNLFGLMRPTGAVRERP
jgi:glycosyltransferase 2 family protein